MMDQVSLVNIDVDVLLSRYRDLWLEEISPHKVS